MTDYYVGQRITITATFTDAADEPFDPTTLEFRVKPYGAAVETFLKDDPDVSNPDVGTFTLSYLIETKGRHHIAIHSTAEDEETVARGEFDVNESV